MVPCFSPSSLETQKKQFNSLWLTGDYRECYLPWLPLPASPRQNIAACLCFLLLHWSLQHWNGGMACWGMLVKLYGLLDLAQENLNLRSHSQAPSSRARLTPWHLHWWQNVHTRATICAALPDCMPAPPTPHLRRGSMVHRSLLGGQDSLELSEVQKARGSVFKCGTSVRVATVRE